MMAMQRMKWMMALGAAALMLAPAAAQKADPAAVMLEAAARKERVDGDLKAAIEQYRRIAAQFAKQPEVAAQALLRMGQCQEKLGQDEARKSYERVVKEYAGAGQYASQARARLAALTSGGQSSSETRARLVWDGAIDTWGCATLDGRLMSFIDWSTGDLAVRDLVAGQHRRVTNKGGYEKALGEAEASCISPDGKRVSFNWNRWDPAAKAEGGYELRVVNIDGSGEQMLRRTQGYVQAYGWSRDSQWLAISFSPDRRSDSRLELIPMNGGQARIIPTAGKLWKDNISFSPDGKWLAYAEPTRPQAEFVSPSVFIVPADGSRAEQLVVEDANVMGWAPDGSGIVVSKKSGEAQRLQLVTVSDGRPNGEPRDLHAPALMAYPGRLGITAGGDVLYSTNNFQREAWMMKFDRASGRWGNPVAKFPVAGIGWAVNGGNLRFSPDGRQFAAFVARQSISIRNLPETRERIITPQLRDHRNFEWAPDGRSFLISATGEDGRFGIHRIDLGTGAASFLCAIQQGHVFVPSADGASIFELSSKGLTSLDLSTCSEKPLPTRSFADGGPGGLKLSRDGKSLLLKNMRYLGVYEIATGALREIHYRKEEVGSMVWTADWSADGRHIYAIVRPGMGNQHPELRIYPAEGGAPAVSPLSGNFRNLTISGDGENVAVVRDQRHMQVWRLENFLPAARP